MVGITVGDLGEFGLVERVTALLPAAAHVVVGPGDDAAVVACPGDVVVTTDMLVEGVHFRRDWSDGYDVGCKAAAQNLADVAAMGARPTALVVALGVPASLPLEWTDALTRGLSDETARAGAAVVGGDVVSSDRVVVAATALGSLDGRAPVLRSGACPGDVVVVAGRLGWSAAGLRLLERGVDDGVLVGAHRRPEPSYDAARSLAAAGATAMIDTSDGLLVDLGRVAAAGAVAVDLDLAALRACGADGVSDADLLTGGEDHAFVATLPAGHAVPAGHVVGRVVAGSGVTVDGRAWDGPGGWEHFR